MIPFTKIPNALYDEVLFDLPHPELLLVLALNRLATGYHREWVSVSETHLMGMTRMARTPLYRAKRALIAKGLLEVSSETGKGCSYRLIETNIPPIPPKKARGGASVGTGACTGTGAQLGTGGVPVGARGGCLGRHKRGACGGTGPILKKDLKKDYKETSSLHGFSYTPGGDDDDDFFASTVLEDDLSNNASGQPSSPEDFDPRSEIDEVPAEADSGKVPGRPRKSQNGAGAPESPRTARESSETQSSSRAAGVDSESPGEESGASAGRGKPRESNSNLPPEFCEMLDIGVSEHVARQFIRDYPLETLRAGLKSVLARVAAGEVRDPAAWFVREVKAGLYGPRKVDILAAQRSKAAEKRLTERQADEQRREAEDQQSRSRRSAVEQSWSAEERADLLRQARRQIGRSDAPEDFPLVRAVMFDLWQARQATYPRSSSCEV